RPRGRLARRRDLLKASGRHSTPGYAHRCAGSSPGRVRARRSSSLSALRVLRLWSGLLASLTRVRQQAGARWSALDYLRDAEIGRLGIGSLPQDFGGHPAGYDDIVAQCGVGGLIVGEQLSHGLDIGGVQFVELADVFEDIVDLLAISFKFGFAEIEIRQV